jgi:hypothetical protein
MKREPDQRQCAGHAEHPGVEFGRFEQAAEHD